MGNPIAFRHRIRGALKDTTGGMLVYFALMLPIVFGFVGLASDVAVWHMESRSVDTMTDSVAYSSALEVMRSTSALQALVTQTEPTPEDIRNARADYMLAVATVEAELNGFDAGRGDTLEVYSPPRSGPRMDDPRAVEVVITRRAPILFGALVGAGDATIVDRAVAVRGATNCVISLNETDSGAITASGQADAIFPCGIHANSDDSTAIKTEGFGAGLTAPTIDVVGGYSGGGFTPTPSTGATVEEDPFAATLPGLIPDYTLQCAVTLAPISRSTGDPTLVIDTASTQVTGPCAADNDNILVIGSDLNIASQSVVHFNPGIYILTGDFAVAGQAVVTGTEVTFIFQNGRIGFSGGVSVNFTAPSSGPLAGLVMIQDPAYPGLLDDPVLNPRCDRSIDVPVPYAEPNEAMCYHSLAGGSSQLLDGVVYFPNSTIQFSGGSSTEKTSTMLIADKLAFTGTTYMAAPMDGAAGTSAALILGLQALLVE